MRKFGVLAGLVLVVGLVAAPAGAHDEEDMENVKFHFHGDVLVRSDYFENYDFNDALAADDNFGIWPYRVRAGMDVDFQNDVRAMIQFQTAQEFGTSGTNFFPGDPRFFFATPTSGTEDVNLYQGFVELNKIGGSNFSARIGRQEHTFGTELLMGDNDFYTGQSFDGGRLMWGWDRFDLNAFYYKIVETNAVPVSISGGSNDTNFSGLTVDWVFENWGDFDAYLLWLQALAIESSRATYGARWGRMIESSNDVSDNPFDWNIEAAFQSGDTGNPPTETDLSGDLVEGWFGWNWNHDGGGRSRVHIGAVMASGDDPTTGAENEAFNPLFQDAHAHNRLGNLELISSNGLFSVSPTTTNIDDLNLGYEYWSSEGRHGLGVAFHWLKLNEEVAVPGGTDDDIGQAIDAWYDFKYNDNVAIEIGASTLLPGDLPDRIPAVAGSADDPLRTWAQVHLRW